MKNKVYARPLNYFYFISLFVLFGCSLFGLYFFWTKGPLNQEGMIKTYEGELVLGRLQDENYLKKIKGLVETDRARDAMRVLNNYTAESSDLNNIENVNGFKEVAESQGNLKKELNRLISLPEMTTILAVLNNKVTSFESFVVDNNWRTLTRISRRLKTRLNPSHLKNSGQIGFERLRKLNRSINSDIDLMEKVTKGSILSKAKKDLILTRLSTFAAEVEMLQNLEKGMAGFLNQINSSDSAYQNWVAEVSPALALNRIKIERQAQNVIFALLGIAGVLLLFMLVGYFIYLRTQRTIARKMESFALRTVKEGIIPTESKVMDHVTSEFTDEVNKFRSYVHKRMSLGSLFQESTPFPSLLLDSNLNVMWANELFYESWGIEAGFQADRTLNWDYIQKSTNLGDGDPIQQALLKDVAGIYQIQYKNHREGESSVPYEMYVVPGEYSSQKRIMVYFYPLTSMERTLSDQAKSIVGPLNRAIELISEDRFSAEAQEKIKSDFEAAGIEKLSKQFFDFYHFIKNQREGLLQEIARLEDMIEAQEKVIQSGRDKVTEGIDGQEKTKKNFVKTRDSIVDMISQRTNLERSYQDSLSNSKKVLKSNSDLMRKSAMINEALGETQKAFTTFAETRETFKSMSKQTESQRSRINQSIDQLLVFTRSNINAADLAEALQNLKTEFRAIDGLLGDLKKSSTTMDVGISKISMIMDEVKTPDLKGSEDQLKQARKFVEDMEYQLGFLAREGQLGEEALVRNLKDLYTSFKNNLTDSKNLDEVLKKSCFDRTPVELATAEEIKQEQIYHEMHREISPEPSPES